MSYTLEIVVQPVPANDDEVRSLVDTLKERYLDDNRPVAPALVRLHDAIVRAYPDEPENDDCPWADSPLIDNFASEMAILGVGARVEEVVAHVVSCARELGVTVLDPQCGSIHRPSDKSDISKPDASESSARKWNKATAREAILAGLFGLLSDKGFRISKGEASLVRKIEGGKQGVGFALYEYHPTYTFSLGAHIRLEVVESILHRFNAVPARQQSAHRTTVVLEQYFTGSRSRHEVSAPGNVDNAIAKISPLVLDRIVPFLDECVDVRGLDAKLNSGTGPQLNAFEGHLTEMFTQLIVARLAGNLRFDDMVAGFEHQTRRYPEADRAQLRQVVEYLRQAQ